MPWNVPRTAAVGDVYTAAWYNADTRDNLLETAPAKVTAAGDIVVATGPNALKRLAAFDGNDRLLAARGGGYIHGLPVGTPVRGDRFGFSNEGGAGDPNERANIDTLLSLVRLGDGDTVPVTYESLVAAGDVGVNSGQLAIGDHDHVLSLERTRVGFGTFDTSIQTWMTLASITPTAGRKSWMVMAVGGRSTSLTGNIRLRILQGSSVRSTGSTAHNGGSSTPPYVRTLLDPTGGATVTLQVSNQQLYRVRGTGTLIIAELDF